jgi:hypothetical protein
LVVVVVKVVVGLEVRPVVPSVVSVVRVVRATVVMVVGLREFLKREM